MLAQRLPLPCVHEGEMNRHKVINRRRLHFAIVPGRLCRFICLTATVSLNGAGAAHLQTPNKDAARASKTTRALTAEDIGETRRRLAELGYWVGKPYWGMGYATEAVRALIVHAFETDGFDYLKVGLYRAN